MVVFKGYAIHSTNDYTDLSVMDFKPKIWDPEYDVEIAITHCGVCGSDVHTVTGGWGDPQLPLIVGHEIVGTVTRVGSRVTDVKPGDRAGVGAQCYACMSPNCKACITGNENYCPHMVDTYNDTLPDGTRTMGGYSTAIIANTQFVFPIPDKIPSEEVCSMFCAGLTVYSPLVRNGINKKEGKGKKLGIVGLGGLGHYAVLFAKAFGAEVFLFSHSKDKEEDAKKMGVDHFVDTSVEGFHKPYALKLDMILSTRDSAMGYPLKEYLSMLWIHGTFITVGLPDDPLPSIAASAFMTNGCRMGSSHLGSKAEVLEMLDLVAEQGIHPWIQQLPMKEAGHALKSVFEGKVRYRYVLTQDIDTN